MPKLFENGLFIEPWQERVFEYALLPEEMNNFFVKKVLELLKAQKITVLRNGIKACTDAGISLDVSSEDACLGALMTMCPKDNIADEPVRTEGVQFIPGGIEITEQEQSLICKMNPGFYTKLHMHIESQAGVVLKKIINEAAEALFDSEINELPSDKLECVNLIYSNGFAMTKADKIAAAEAAAAQQGEE